MRPATGGRASVRAALALVALLTALPAGAQQRRPPARAADARPAAGVAGRVLDASTGRAVDGARVEVVELALTAGTGADGGFRLPAVAPGAYTLLVRRLGYAPSRSGLRVAAGPTTVTVRLTPSPIALDEVVVTGVGGRRDAYGPALALEGAALDRRLGGSVAATLAGEPGVTQRYNGPAAAQPVIRGLGGDRVLVLEDGQRTGDVATTAADHAVTVDPLTAERIEVVRGPAGLLFGSTTVGGVVNVVREDVPRALPERLGATMSVQGESANAGLTAGGVVRARVGPVALRADYSGRTANDSRTPRGMLPYTDLDGSSAGVGASVVGARGFVGGAVRDVRNFYGVPATFGGRTIPGAHDGGVYVDLHRVSGRVQGELRGGAGALRSLHLDGGYSWFKQSEVERGGVTGTEFGQLLGTATLLARYRSSRVPGEGAVGAWALGRDWAAAGSYTGTRPARQVAWAGFAYHELARGPVRVQVGGRYDRTRLTPLDTASSRIGNNTLLTNIRERHFQALTGSASALYEVAPSWTAGVTLARSFRAPAVEELYSNGPHLANYAYEVGNPTLDPEVGLGGDLFVRLRRAQLTGELTVFATRIRDYVRYAPLLDARTGAPLRDYRLRRYQVYQAAQADAAFRGAEGQVAWQPWAGWAVEGTAQYVRGTDLASGAPLPFMPPLQGRVGVRRDVARYFAGVGADWSARQRRVPPFPSVLAPDDAAATAGATLLPGEFVPTTGRLLLEATAGLRIAVRGRPHTVTLQVDNLLDRPWHDALSRIKTVAPQPGRNVRLLYRVEL